MRKSVLLALGLFVAACGDTPTDAPVQAPPVALSGVGGEHAAIRFEGPNACLAVNPLDPTGDLFLGSVASVTTNGTTGRTMAICRGQLDNPTGRAFTSRDVPCLFNADPVTEVLGTESQLTITPRGAVTAYCGFQAQAADTYVLDAENAYPAVEGAITTPLAEIGGEVSGELVDIGAACNADLPLPDLTGKIALILRGNCPTPGEILFTSKLGKAEAAGAIAAIVYNDFGDVLVTMGGDPVSIPGVFVGNSSGIALQSESSVTLLECEATGRSLTCKGRLQP